MNLWEDREDFHPLGHHLQRVDQEAYCDKTQPSLIRRRVTKVKPVGEFADMEIDRALDDYYWDRDGEPEYDFLPTRYTTPWRPGFSAPKPPPVLLTDFPLLFVPELCAVCLKDAPEHERHCAVGSMNGYTSLEPPLEPREMEVLEWPGD